MQRHSLTKVLFVLPSLFAFTMVILIPFFYGLYFSMTDWNGVSDSIKFIGFVHFGRVFTQPSFVYSFLISAAYTAINVVLVNAFGFVLALVVTSNLRFRNFYRAGFFAPYLIGGIVLGYIWQFLFNNTIPSFGKAFSIEAFQTSFLSRSASVIWAMSIVNTWQYAGYIMLIFIAAIQAIPTSLMEAAKVDGAGYFRRVFRILIPMMANAFTISLFLTLTTSFKQFDMNLTLTNGGPATRFLGQPVMASQLLAMDIFNTAKANRMAEAQAIAVILFVALVVVSIIQVSINKSKEVEL
ncbi:MAG TPA: sugar ABC transporter permease [Rectinemataceae bacterium]|nr:sugar ABC transporter permease [Rectinemataceae bacterium]